MMEIGSVCEYYVQYLYIRKLLKIERTSSTLMLDDVDNELDELDELVMTAAVVLSRLVAVAVPEERVIPLLGACCCSFVKV